MGIKRKMVRVNTVGTTTTNTSLISGRRLVAINALLVYHEISHISQWKGFMYQLDAKLAVVFVI